MYDFGWGCFLGVSVTALASALGARFQRQRILSLERRARQAERLAELGTLTSGLAHEIKNPLSTVQLNLQLLREEFDPRDPKTPRVIKRLDTVQREAGRLRDILDDFLRYAGKVELERAPANLNELLNELADFFSPQAMLQKVQLRLHPSTEPVTANIDARLIKQAVLNLMINGVQAMTDGGELILTARARDGYAFIDVIDTGPGIPPDVQANIFKAYYSTKRGGTGLGLAISQRMIHEHGGTLTVKSEMGKGSDFTIQLPRD